MTDKTPAVVVQRTLPASPDVVFDEWLDPVGMAEWMCPRPARPTPRIGGGPKTCTLAPRICLANSMRR